MQQLDQIPNRQERLILAELALNLMKIFRDGLRKAGAPRESLYITPAIYVASFSGRGITLSQISKLTSVPRATAERRLKTLIARGLVRRDGRYYWINDDKLINPPANISRATLIVRQAALELQKIRPERAR